MRMNNPLQLNDLDIKSFLRIILAIQLAMFGVIGLDAIGLQIPILRQLICFIYLTFIPGIIILRILRIYNLSAIDTFLYAVGLSLSFLMFLGVLMNTLYPLLGISRPISLFPLVTTISIGVLILCILSYMTDKNLSNTISKEAFSADLKEAFSPILFFCLIVFSAILGAYLVNYYQNNVLLMLMFVMIALAVVLIVYDRLFPKELYPLLIFIIALALLYHISLISKFVTSGDVFNEIYFSHLVRINSKWIQAIPETNNAMLSIVMCAPIYSILLGMNLTWLFKLLYPLIYSLVPVGLYNIFQRQTNEKVAFLACFYFMCPIMFGNMVGVEKQIMGEFFLTLLIMLMVSREISGLKKKIMFIVFMFSLIVSHEGTSYVFMLLLVFALLLIKISRLMGRKFNINYINRSFVLVYIVLLLAWYIYISNSSTFEVIVKLGNHIVNSIFTDFLNPISTGGMNLLVSKKPSLLQEVGKYLNVILQVFTIVGLIKVLRRRTYRETEFCDEYLVFSIIWIVMWLASLLIPYFTHPGSSIGAGRLYHLSLLFLAPFCIIGGKEIISSSFYHISSKFQNIRHIRRVKDNTHYVYMHTNLHTSLRILSVILVIFLLFEYGFIYEVANDRPTSIPLSIYRYEESDINTKLLFKWKYLFEQEVASARWLYEKRDVNILVYSDYLSQQTILRAYGNVYNAGILSNKTESRGEKYVYLNYLNVRDGVFHGYDPKVVYGVYYDITEISHFLMNKIYSNRGSEIYYYE